MANHVNSYLRFESISDDGKKRLKEVIDLIKSRSDHIYEHHLALYANESLDGVDINWMCENVGAKWAYATDMDEDGISMYSAWSPTSAFCKWLVEYIGEVDDSVTGTHTYEDEMPNFIGVDIYDAGGHFDGIEIDSEEMFEEITTEHPDLLEFWDEEEECWKDDGEQYQEVLYDWIADWQWRQTKSMLEAVPS